MNTTSKDINRHHRRFWKHYEPDRKVLYKAKTQTTGGREDDASRSSDGGLNVRLSTPGSAHLVPTRSNRSPSLGRPASKVRSRLRPTKKNRMPAVIDAEVDLNLEDSGYFLRTRLNIGLPSIEHQARAMAEVAYDKELTALLVIDPYNDFISEGDKLWDRIRGVAEANDCVPHMLQVLNAARKAKLRVFYALHHRYRPGDYETWKYIAPIQKASWKRKSLRHVGRRDPSRVGA